MSKRLTLFLIIILVGFSFAGMKNVAVVETEVDLQASELTPAEVRQITGELRREAVKNLPRDRYNVMTSETVYAQGGAVLAECADENCVITLGSKIGADFIVRGIISKFQTRFTLSVEIYETEDGNLVASSDPVRSENIGELLERTASVCAEMYRTFADVHAPAPKIEPEPAPQKAVKMKMDIASKLPKKKSFWIGIGLDAIGAGLLAYGFYEEGNVKNIVNGDGAYQNKSAYESAKKAGNGRNIGYVAGGALLLGGLSIHILF